jgi:hypothetical protein
MDNHQTDVRSEANIAPAMVAQSEELCRASTSEKEGILVTNVRAHLQPRAKRRRVISATIRTFLASIKKAIWMPGVSVCHLRRKGSAARKGLVARARQGTTFPSLHLIADRATCWDLKVARRLTKTTPSWVILALFSQTWTCETGWKMILKTWTVVV